MKSAFAIAEQQYPHPVVIWRRFQFRAGEILVQKNVRIAVGIEISDSDAEAAEIGVLREVTAFAASERQNVWPSFPVAAEAPRSPRS